jgi:hypothetical protein
MPLRVLFAFSVLATGVLMWSHYLDWPAAETAEAKTIQATY